MALQANISGLPQSQKSVKPRKPQGNAEDVKAATQPNWVEGSPSYLDGILETLATLTEEEKEALHHSLQG